MSTLLLCGDVMTGRGVDQVLPHPGDPRLREPYARDARHYVNAVAERAGPIRLPVPYTWLWGDALTAIEQLDPDARVLNLETSVTRCADFAPRKGIHYRMNPANVPAVSVARPDVCVLANNHVLDFGRRGLRETLTTLDRAGLPTAGAGRDLAEAARPASVPLPGARRMLVFAAATESSGVPPSWAATVTKPGVHFLPELDDTAIASVADAVAAVRRPGDIVVFSVHWGSNWGYSVPREQVRFAHRLVDAGVDIVHGHSSHHPRPIELYRGRLILYGCGDLINDYEGITGYAPYRDDLRLLYHVSVDNDGVVNGVRMQPLRAAQLRLHRAAREEADWLGEALTDASRPFGTRVELEPDGLLTALAD